MYRHKYTDTTITAVNRPPTVRPSHAVASDLPSPSRYPREHGRMQASIGALLEAWDTGRGIYIEINNMRDLYNEITGKKPAESAGEYRVK